MINAEIIDYPFEGIAVVCIRLPIAECEWSSNSNGRNVTTYRPGYAIMRRSGKTGKISASVIYGQPNPHDSLDRQMNFVRADDQEAIDEAIAALNKRGYKDIIIERHITWASEYD